MSRDSQRWREHRDQLARNSTSEIRLLCPRGHFIVNVQVHVPAADILGGDDPPILIAPRATEGGSLGHGQTLGDVYDAQTPQFRMYQAKGYRVSLQCKRSKCGYHGSFDYDGLSVDLAKAISSGHTEHRLIN